MRIESRRFSIPKIPKDLGEGDIGGVLKTAMLKKKLQILHIAKNLAKYRKSVIPFAKTQQNTETATYTLFIYFVLQNYLLRFCFSNVKES